MTKVVTNWPEMMFGKSLRSCLSESTVGLWNDVIKKKGLPPQSQLRGFEMTKTIIHLSDIHFCSDWAEDLDVVLNEFFKDLEKQVAHLTSTNVFIAFSGDIVQEGKDSNLYDLFIEKFTPELDRLKISKNQRICVPGNHDISQTAVDKDLINHEGVVSQSLGERVFNDYLQKPSNIFKEKFKNYINFESMFADVGISSSSFSGKGWEIDENIGIYCLNSALCSSGGIKNKDGSFLVDKNRLAIDTRELHKWNQKCKSKWKILLMHHPISWLNNWSRKEIKQILRKDFSLCLSGHAHDQEFFHSLNEENKLIECSAPPLLTDKFGDLGYSIVSICPEKGVTEIAYRQWTKHRSFVAGVNFSNTDNGKIVIHEFKEITKTNNHDNNIEHDFVKRYFSKRLDEALLSFTSQPKVWVEPVLSKSSDVDPLNPDEDEELKVDLNKFIKDRNHTFIKAPPQFGLTCLAHHLVLEAWTSTEKDLWIYLDFNLIKLHTIERHLDAELNIIGLDISNVKCIVLDSWSGIEKNSHKVINKIGHIFPDIRLIVMHSVDHMQFKFGEDKSPLDREFCTLYLRSLPRGHIRKVVTEYNDVRHIGDDDSVITKVVSDLEMLNIHRTPLNCLTLLKVSEVDFDESPVNRTEMIKRVLFLLFNMDHIPTYKVRPDLKDCEYVLGRFCEIMIRENKLTFTREYFLAQLKQFCKEKVLDLEVQVVFDVLHANNILIKQNGEFRFRFTYWIYYFAAQRMHQDKIFADFIYEDMRYASYPEIIEFYTGIDRRRDDAISILARDIKSTYNKVVNKCGISNDLNPYKFAKWLPSPEVVEKMQNEISDGVKDSKLPESVKDRYADRHYDSSRAYNQDIMNIFEEYSLVLLTQSMRAAAKALRNSDYVDPELKHDMIQLILQCWEHLTQVLIILSPILASKGYVNYQGVGFLFNSDFGESEEERFNAILSAIPINLIYWFKDDLYSRKMGPLLISQFNKEEGDLRKHELVLLLINTRPRGWKSVVQNYIASTQKNSFYLADVCSCLRSEYRYSYASSKELSDIKYLIKMAIAKHDLGKKKPGVKWINKISDNVIPKRQIDNFN